MNVIAKLGLISAICGLVACKPESQLDLTSIANQGDNHTTKINGYVITEQNNLLAIPDDYIELHKLSEHLLNRHWLQNPNFLTELEQLQSLFKKTRLPEANVFIRSLEESKKRYLTSVDNADLIARSVQRELDKDLDCYDRSIKELKQKIRFLHTPKEHYSHKAEALTEQIKELSRQYSRLNAELHQSLESLLAKQAPGNKLISDIKFDYIQLPHSICGQYKGMSELLTSVPQNCVYINRDQLLSPFSSNHQIAASEIIDNYAAQIWHTMTQLNGFFNTVDNKQYFPNNLNNRLSLIRKALREKDFLNDDESTKLNKHFHKKLKQLEKKREDKVNAEYLDQQLRIDTSSVAFINQFCTAEPPTKPFAEAYRSIDSMLRFTKAYTDKMLREYPAELHFAISQDGLFTIPHQKQAQQLIIDLDGTDQFLTYNMVKRSELPYIISARNKNATIVSHSLPAELDMKLRHYWFSGSQMILR